MKSMTASRITRISLLTLLGALLVSIAVLPQVSFALTGTNCKTTSGTGVSENFIQVEIPIPGVTQRVICEDQSVNPSVALAPVYAVEDLGAYIAGIYQYFVSFVGILAVVMIMYAGVRWILAAGNQSRIAGAKSIMSSAIIGVVIAFCSYLLLYLLNPATVDLTRLKATFDSTGLNNLTNIGLQGFTCKDLPADTKVQIETLGLACRSSSSACPDVNIKDAIISAGDVGCGSVAKVVDPNAKGSAKLGQQCVGTKCKSNGSCILDQCVIGFLAGTIDWVQNAYVDNIWIDGVCNDGTWVAGKNSNLNEGTHFYKFAEKLITFSPNGTSGTSDMISDFNNISNTCNSHTGLAGYMLRVEVNDDQGSGFNLLPTEDDRFFVDRNCKVIEGRDGQKEPNSFYKDLHFLISSGRLFSVSDFFDSTPPVFNFKQTPYVCNLSINRQDFPAR